MGVVSSWFPRPRGDSNGVAVTRLWRFEIVEEAPTP